MTMSHTNHVAPLSRPLAGMLWAVGATLCYVVMIGLVRYLGTGLPTAQSAFLRFAIGLVFLFPVILTVFRTGLPSGTATLFLSRGAIHTAGVAFWFFAMARLPVAETTAIGYLTPVAMTFGAALMFGEKITAVRLGALAFAIAGSLVVLRPGTRELGAGHIAQIIASILFAVSFLQAKRLSQCASPSLIVTMMALSVTVLLAPLALAVWKPVSLDQSVWLALSALFATLANYCQTKSYALAPLTVTQPIGFLQLVWATLMGVTIFGEAVDVWVLVGGSVIIAAAVWVVLWEGWRSALPETAGR